MAFQPFPLENVPAALQGGVVAVGNFDGIHRGHQVLLKAATGEARHLGVPAVVLTFEPHPRSFFRPETPVFRLTPLPVKARVLAALGIDGLVVATFDRAFSSTTAESFVADILIARLKLKAAVVGYNFHFGKGRAGSSATLAEAGKRFGFSVTAIGQVSEDGGESVSSSAIRQDLEAGDVAAANARFGYRWFVIGEVITGDRRGRELGFPTANIRLDEATRLRHGIYAVKVRRADGSVHDGVASYGRRPTFDNGPPLLEVFVFDFSGDLYGEVLAVSFIGWVRPELKFASVDDLIVAMNRDSAKARQMLAAAGEGSALDRALAGTA